MLLFGISGVSRQHEEFKRNKLRNGNGIEKVKEKYKDKDKEKKGNKKRVGGAQPNMEVERRRWERGP